MVGLSLKSPDMYNILSISHMPLDKYHNDRHDSHSDEVFRTTESGQKYFISLWVLRIKQALVDDAIAQRAILPIQ